MATENPKLKMDLPPYESTRTETADRNQVLESKLEAIIGLNWKNRSSPRAYGEAQSSSRRGKEESKMWLEVCYGFEEMDRPPNINDF